MANYKRIFEDGYSYYLTIVTHQRNPILIKNITLLRESFRMSKRQYNYEINEIVILPDHLHMIITPSQAEDYPHIVRTIKQYFSKHCNPKYYKHLDQSQGRTKEGYKAIWQKKYYEHTIRGEKDLQEKMRYMYNNPVKHDLVEKEEDWEYSSFKRFHEGGSINRPYGEDTKNCRVGLPTVKPEESNQHKQ